MQGFKLGIIGYPLGHTLSPLLHQSFLRACRLTGQYEVYETQLLENMLNQLAMRGVHGFNVTIPYKVDMLAYCHTLTERAKRVQAVNTVKRVNQQWHGDNTDVTGYIDGLPMDIRDSLHQRRVVVLGAGGAARAVLVGLMEAGVTRLTLVARSVEKAKALQAVAQSWQRQFQQMIRIDLQPWEQLTDLSQTQLLINTTPIGMKSPDACPVEVDLLHSLPADAYVSDLIYNPLETRLVSEAHAVGCRASGGLPMLVHQGVKAFEWWTGEQLHPNAIRSAHQTLHNRLGGTVHLSDEFIETP